jgi:molybdate transport system permease protein
VTPRGNAVEALAGRIYVTLAVTVLAVLLVLPLVALVTRAPLGAVLSRLAGAEVRQALTLSVWTTAVATVLIVALGLPAAYLLGTRRFPGKRVCEVLVELPIVLPPTAAGLALLLAFGRAGLAGDALRVFGISLPFTTAAVIAAQVFVGAPFFISTAVAGIRAVEPRYLDAAATLGATPAKAIRRVLLPLAAPAFVAGAVLAWARALGEFGATMMFAGSLPGRTQTMPLAVYGALDTDLTAAITLALVLLILSAGALLAVRTVPWRVRVDAARDA